MLNLLNTGPAREDKASLERRVKDRKGVVQERKGCDGRGGRTELGSVEKRISDAKRDQDDNMRWDASGYCIEAGKRESEEIAKPMVIRREDMGGKGRVDGRAKRGAAGEYRNGE